MTVGMQDLRYAKRGFSFSLSLTMRHVWTSLNLNIFSWQVANSFINEKMYVKCLTKFLYITLINFSNLLCKASFFGPRWGRHWQL